MRLLRDYRDIPDEFSGGVFALGNFDGLHRGHRALIHAANEAARARGVASGVLTFEPHPRRVFQPDAPPFRLTPFRSKVRLLRHLQVDVAACLRFNEALYSKPAETFIEDVLIGGLKVSGVVVGYDFVFGHRRSGHVDLLRETGATRGFDVTVVSPVAYGDDVCSSTTIRVNLQSGRVRRAAELLGHCWEVEGRVRGGDRRGRTIGFPTANLHLRRQGLTPTLGVYAVWFGLVGADGATRWHPGVANLGTRPTFNGTGVVLESHLFDFDQDIYGRLARVAFVEFLRPERKFDGFEALKAQIAADRDQARALLQRPENAHETLVLP